MHNLCSIKTVITAVLMVTSGPKNLENKRMLVMLLTHDDDVIMMFNDYSILVYDHVG
jgi:hypothetical protein